MICFWYSEALDGTDWMSLHVCRCYFFSKQFEELLRRTAVVELPRLEVLLLHCYVSPSFSRYCSTARTCHYPVVAGSERQGTNVQYVGTFGSRATHRWARVRGNGGVQIDNLRLLPSAAFVLPPAQLPRRSSRQTSFSIVSLAERPTESDY